MQQLGRLSGEGKPSIVLSRTGLVRFFHGPFNLWKVRIGFWTDWIKLDVLFFRKL